MRPGQDDARPVARGVFCRWPCRDSCGFFLIGGIAQIPARPLRRFSRAFQGGISFRAQGHFVSDFSREKIDQWSQCVAGHENLKRNETQKKRHAEVCKCGGSHPHASPPGRTRDFRTTGGVPGGSQHVVGKAFHSLPAARRSLFRGKGWVEPPKSPGGPELYGRADQSASTDVIIGRKSPECARRSRRSPQ